MNQYCFLNGQIIPLSEAKVSVLDIGLLRGFGVYDGLMAINAKPFRFADHWQRFTDGAHALGLNIPITEESCEKKIIEILTKSQLIERANVRMILTGGNTVGGIEFVFENPTFYITAEKWESLPKEYYESGAKLVTYNYQREMPEHKTINYITAVKLQDWKKGERAVEILYVHDGEVLECATSNICLVKDGKLFTPAENVLGGITLKVVLELANQFGLEVEKKIIYQDELKTADEVFITSSFKDIVPIVKIDDLTIADGQVGPITKDLMVKFASILNP
jgi:branched-chain amino acid aminotransferase